MAALFPTPLGRDRERFCPPGPVRTHRPALGRKILRKTVATKNQQQWAVAARQASLGGPFPPNGTAKNCSHRSPHFLKPTLFRWKSLRKLELPKNNTDSCYKQNPRSTAPRTQEGPTTRVTHTDHPTPSDQPSLSRKGLGKTVTTEKQQRPSCK